MKKYTILIFLFIMLIFVFNWKYFFYPPILKFDSANTQAGICALNYLRYGPFKLGFTQILNPGNISKDFSKIIYWSWPPFIFLLTALNLKIFGVDVSVIRIQTYAFYLFFLYIFYLFLKKTFGYRIAFVSILLLIFMPVNIYYRKFAFPENYSLMFLIIILILYNKWCENYEKKYFMFFGFVSIFSLLIWWDTFFLIVSITFIHIITKQKKLKYLFITTATLLFFFIFYYIFVFVFNEIEFTSFIDKFKSRGVLSVGNIPFKEYLIYEIKRQFILFGLLPIIFIFSLIICFFKFKKKNFKYYISTEIKILMIFTVYNILYHFFTYSSAYNHEYWAINYGLIYCLTPFFLLKILKNKIIYLGVIFIILISSTIFYRLNFTRIRGYRQWYNISKVTNYHLKENEVMLTNMDSLPYYYCSFIIQRNYVIGLKSIEDFKNQIKKLNSYKKYIIIQNTESNKYLIENLNKEFKYILMNGYYIYNI